MVVLALQSGFAQSAAPVGGDVALVLGLRRDLAEASGAVEVRREALAAARESVLAGAHHHARAIGELREGYSLEAAASGERIERLAGTESRELDGFQRWRDDEEARLAGLEQAVADARRAYEVRKAEHDARLAELGALVSRFNDRVGELQAVQSNESARRALVDALVEMQRGIEEGKADIGRLRAAALERYETYRKARDSLEDATRQVAAERATRGEALAAERARLNAEIESIGAGLEARRAEVKRRIEEHEEATREEIVALQAALDGAVESLRARFGDDPAGLYDALGRWLENGDTGALLAADGSSPRFDRARPGVDAAYGAIERLGEPGAGPEFRVVEEPPKN